MDEDQGCFEKKLGGTALVPIQKCLREDSRFYRYLGHPGYDSGGWFLPMRTSARLALGRGPSNSSRRWDPPAPAAT